MVAIIIVGGFYWLSKISKKEEGVRPGEAISVQGAKHISVGDSHPEYNSNPPTSGWHYAGPADWGFYDEELPDEQLVHSLEHGGIWISYKDIDEETKGKLKELGGRYPKSVITTPRAKNDAKIVLASWGRLQKFDQYDEEAIKSYIKANLNKSPEPLAM